MDLEMLKMNVFCYNTTISARIALGDGIPAESVAQVLEDLAAAIRDPGTVIEDLSPISTGGTLSELAG